MPWCVDLCNLVNSFHPGQVTDGRLTESRLVKSSMLIGTAVSSKQKRKKFVLHT